MSLTLPNLAAMADVEDQKATKAGANAPDTANAPGSADTANETAMPTGARGRFGRNAELAAARWYRNFGYRVVATNWRCRHGEIDLIVALGDTVVFVEVKARSTSRFGTGAEAVDWRKQRKVRAVARYWLIDQKQHYPELRFDVVDVDGRGNLQVIQDCF